MCGLSLPSREYYFDDNFSKKRELFKTHLENVVKLVEKNDKENCIKMSNTFVQDVIDFEKELASYMMKRAQSREYDRYYTNSTLSGLYEDINNLNSLPEKESNYDDSDRNYRVTDETIAKIKVFFETIYGLFNFREILQSNRLKHFQYSPEGPNVEHCTAFDGDGIRRVLSMILEEKTLTSTSRTCNTRLLTKYSAFARKILTMNFLTFIKKSYVAKRNRKLQRNVRSIL